MGKCPDGYKMTSHGCIDKPTTDTCPDGMETIRGGCRYIIPKGGKIKPKPTNINPPVSGPGPHYVSEMIEPHFPTPECFVAGTKVIMKNAPDKNIEDIKVGEEVLSYNVYSKQLEPKKVIELFTQTHDLKDGDITVKIRFNNGTITHNTIANPFLSKNKGFVAVDADRSNKLHSWVKTSNYNKDTKKLNINDLLFSYNEETGKLNEAKVEKIELIMVPGIRTYDITVQDNHTFFANGILTHNSGEGGIHGSWCQCQCDCSPYCEDPFDGGLLGTSGEGIGFFCSGGDGTCHSCVTLPDGNTYSCLGACQFYNNISAGGGLQPGNNTFCASAAPGINMDYPNNPSNVYDAYCA